MNFRGHSYIPLGWFVSRLKLIWAGHRMEWALANLAKLPWLCGHGDWGMQTSQLGNLHPIIWQSGLGKILSSNWQNRQTEKWAMWTSQFGKEKKNRLQYELGKMPKPEAFPRRVFNFWDNRLNFFKYQIKELPSSGLPKRVSGGYEPSARIVPVACDAGYMSRLTVPAQITASGGLVPFEQWSTKLVLDSLPSNYSSWSRAYQKTSALN